MPFFYHTYVEFSFLLRQEVPGRSRTIPMGHTINGLIQDLTLLKTPRDWLGLMTSFAPGEIFASVTRPFFESFFPFSCESRHSPTLLRYGQWTCCCLTLLLSIHLFSRDVFHSLGNLGEFWVLRFEKVGKQMSAIWKLCIYDWSNHSPMMFSHDPASWSTFKACLLYTSDAADE